MTPGIDDIMVYGDSFKNFLVAVVFSGREFVERVSEFLGVEGKYEDLIKDKTVKEHFLKNLGECAVKNGMLKFEFVKDLVFSDMSFLELGIMTETLKLKRYLAVKYFKQELKEMYSGSEEG